LNCSIDDSSDDLRIRSASAYPRRTEARRQEAEEKDGRRARAESDEESNTYPLSFL
jgi:hypothetical protein